MQLQTSTFSRLRPDQRSPFLMALAELPVTAEVSVVEEIPVTAVTVPVAEESSVEAEASAEEAPAC